MIETILPGPRSGVMEVLASKSSGHRLLIAAALTPGETRLRVDGLSDDILATMDCLKALGASIREEEDGVLRIKGILPGNAAPTMDSRGTDDALFMNSRGTDDALLPCRESGSTLRFFLPLAAALGIPAVFLREGRLSERPLAPLDGLLSAHGAKIVPDGKLLRLSRKLTHGSYEIPGNISSQYITGLLLSLPLLSGDSILKVTGPVESSPYITITERVLVRAGIRYEKADWTYRIPGNQTYRLPAEAAVERDWSGAAFPLCMGAFSEKGISVPGLDPESPHGDRQILTLLKAFGAEVTVDADRVTVRNQGPLTGITIDASEVPDLVPALCAVAAGAEGETRVIRGERLRLKESDRIRSVVRMLKGLSADAEETEDGMIIHGKKQLQGGTVDPENDHRIAMAAAVAAGICREPVLIRDAACVRKSFPGFFDKMKQLEVNA